LHIRNCLKKAESGLLYKSQILATEPMEQPSFSAQGKAAVEARIVKPENRTVQDVCEFQFLNRGCTWCFLGAFSMCAG